MKQALKGWAWIVALWTLITLSTLQAIGVIGYLGA
jgi:hypothetical protein|tara:strand:+ start:991 stop:1095 length:105 start_codon:yes stop_codon:yes gene_type:complete